MVVRNTGVQGVDGQREGRWSHFKYNEQNNNLLGLHLPDKRVQYAQLNIPTLYCTFT